MTMSEPRESQLIENVPLDGDTNEARQALKKKKATTPGNPRPSTSKHQDTSPAPDISEPERPNCGQNKRKVNSREVVSEQELNELEVLKKRIKALEDSSRPSVDNLIVKLKEYSLRKEGDFDKYRAISILEDLVALALQKDHDNAHYYKVVWSP